MNAESEKLCLQELDHLILDVGKKVTLTHITNNWFTLSKHAENVLRKWLKNYSGDKQIAKEYLIRGTDAHGNSVITVVSEKSLSKVAEICPNHTQTLYSLEIGSVNGKSLNIPEPSANKYIALKIKSEKRNIAVSKIVVPPPVKKEPTVVKKPTNIFGAAQSKPQSTKDGKNESNSANNSKDVNVKEEKTSPKISPKKNQPTAKASAKGQQAKASSSIASFFGPKSSTSTTHDKSISDAASKIEKVQIKDEPTENVKNETANTNKRQLSNASDSAEDSKAAMKKQKVQAKKKIKLEPKSARSRVMQICDSSSDEDEAPNSKDDKMECDEETVVKKEKENKTPSPEKADPNKSNAGSTGSRKRRIKVKKMVTRTYEDDDGFINTVREMEEVSCSEEESEVVEPPPKKIAPAAAASAASNGKSAAPSSKKKISPPVGKKQGSLLSFFAKK